MPPGFHTTARELQTCILEGPNTTNTTDIPREDPKRQKKKSDSGGREREKKSAKCWASRLRAPPFEPPRCGAPPFGPPPFGPPTLQALTFSRSGPHRSPSSPPQNLKLVWGLGRRIQPPLPLSQTSNKLPNLKLVWSLGRRLLTPQTQAPSPLKPVSAAACLTLLLVLLDKDSESQGGASVAPLVG